MASLSDLILGQVKAAAGNVQIPSGVKKTVIDGLADSVLGSLQQTALKSGGIDQIKSLVTGKVKAEKSPVTDLAGKLFQNNVLKGLNLGAAASAVSGLVPTVMGSLSKIVKDQDGDGDIDLNDLLIMLKGGGASKGAASKGAALKGSGLLGAATGLLGSILKK